MFKVTYVAIVCFGMLIIATRAPLIFWPHRMRKTYTTMHV